MALSPLKGGFPNRRGNEFGSRFERMSNMKRKTRVLSLTTKQLSKSALQQLKRDHARSWAEVVKPIKEAVRRSEQLTDEDFAVRINARS